ncbi:MAG: RagB/SusD family nutrient uptake outer membrane protein [Bacteroidales bacterium]|nr:RagB/SusD family nutrient uptake outer membrane protein [Bacteroidales bacterium]
MKRIFKYIALVGLCLGLVSCDKFFDDMEGDLSKVSGENMAATENGLISMLASLYGYMPINAFSTGDQGQFFANGSRSTPTYYSSTAGFWNYTAIRDINKFLESLESAEQKGIINSVTRNHYRGEGLFIRAYCYFAQVRTYGGIPIVDKTLDDQYDGKDNKGLYYPRKTEKESWDWVIDQFQQAADLLPETQAQEMRVNKYTALGMKARAALWAASESKYWDRAPIDAAYNAVIKELTYMKSDYANQYYQLAIDAAADVINSGKYALYEPAPASIGAAIDNLTELFQNYKKIEGLLGRSFKSGSAEGGNGCNAWGPNQVTTGYTGTGAASYTITLNLADEYDYYDNANDRKIGGRKIQTLVSGSEDAYFNDVEAEMTAAKVANYKKYDAVTDPFTMKDARFQAWVIYPGATFRGTTIYAQGGYVDTDGKVYVYPTKNDTLKLGDKIYFPYGGAVEDNSAFYRLKTDVNSNNRSFYCFFPRKYLDQKANNANTQSPWYDLRYAEVLLTYAEAVAESGLGNATLAEQYLNDIRHRAGFKDNIPLTVANVMHEWKVEFALENKWSDVLWRRRAFYNPDNAKTPDEGESNIGQKLTLIPLVDLTGTEAKYIFLRALPYSATSHFNGYSGDPRFTTNEVYYGGIPNTEKNKIEPNNK